MIPRSQTFRSPLLVLWISPENQCHILWLRSLGWGQSDYRWLNPRVVSKAIHFALTNEKLLNGAVVRPSCYTKIGLLLYEDRVAEGKYRNNISRQNHVYSKIIFPDLPGLWYSLNDIDIQYILSCSARFESKAAEIQHIASRIACLYPPRFRLITVASSSARPMGFSSAAGGVLLIMKSPASLWLCVFISLIPRFPWRYWDKMRGFCGHTHAPRHSPELSTIYHIVPNLCWLQRFPSPNLTSGVVWSNLWPHPKRLIVRRNALLKMITMHLTVQHCRKSILRLSSMTTKYHAIIQAKLHSLS